MFLKRIKDVFRMKRCLSLLLVLCLLGASLTAFADFAPAPTPTPLPGYTLKATEDTLRVLATANAKGNIVGYVDPNGQQYIHVLRIQGEWCYISFTSGQGISYGYLPLSCFEAPAKPTPTPAPEIWFEPGTPAWIMNSAEDFRLNLREEPSVSAASLGKYYTGTPITLTGQMKNGFAQVLLAGVTIGWIDVRFLTTDSLAFVPELPSVTIQNPGSGANLRSGPATSYSRLGWYRHGTKVTVLGVRSDGWYHVVIEDTVGYISETLLSGSFPFGYGSDSDDPLLHDNMANGETTLYLNLRTKGGSLNLRKEATIASKSLGVFYTGTPVTIVSYTRTGWAYVRIGHTEGYMDADYLAAAKPTQCGEDRIIRNSKASGLNLRRLPSTGSEVLAFLDNYSQVTVLGQLSDGWCYVQVGETLGYMMGTYLEKAK